MQTPDLDVTGILDQAYERLHRTGPEFEGYLANHGPMAAEALVQLCLGEHVHRWLDGYSGKLEDRPIGTARITPADFAEAPGDPRRVGDWLDSRPRSPTVAGARCSPNGGLGCCPARWQALPTP